MKLESWTFKRRRWIIFSGTIRGRWAMWWDTVRNIRDAFIIVELRYPKTGWNTAAKVGGNGEIQGREILTQLSEQWWPDRIDTTDLETCGLIIIIRNQRLPVMLVWSLLWCLCLARRLGLIRTPSSRQYRPCFRSLHHRLRRGNLKTTCLVLDGIRKICFLGWLYVKINRLDLFKF